ncbi:MBL fold metallo-hydrolase [Paenibacillus rhizosphaerae]|uniref:MBL fold metallo-hydrolase n=1 Tax=Paenibacillus rhizosphaerae TaxID=297318 RepID=A0A1R1F2T7_9BACL|nr:MBL fold metallo-hydrolase [Paenibacillus rhizosphaerae]OMF58276.1 MBL fold metallo-hydrolase [Paenibacillus rhizosphaerae]
MEKGTDQELSYGSDYHYIPATSAASGEGVEVRPDVYSYTVQIVNIVLAGAPQAGSFVLIDAGMPGSADDIIRMVEERFGSDRRPEAIILTHAHFDHVGALIDLVKHWEVPVYAHKLEMPYLTGQESYPKPDPTVEGGVLAKLSFAFPNEPVNVGPWVKPLPDNGSVPGMPEYRWIPTPGHSPGHVSLFRERDRTLIAGDAFTTVRQDELYKVLTQKVEISGPPRYFTPDWFAAWQSVKRLEALHPDAAVTGHGEPVTGETLAAGLKRLVEQFDSLAIPDHGTYVKRYEH